MVCPPVCGDDSQALACGLSPVQVDSYGKTILTHTSNAKCFRNVTLINIRGLAVITVPFRGYDRLSPNQVMIKRERLTDEVLLLFS